MDLATELSTDPLARGYAGMTDAQVLTSLEAVDRPVLREAGVLREYLILNRYRSNDGTDTTLSAIWGRLESLAEAAVGSDPFGRSDTVSMVEIHAAKALMELARADSIAMIDYDSTEIDAALSAVAGGTGARAMGPGDVNNIKALTTGRQTRWQENGWTRPPTLVEIGEARA